MSVQSHESARSLRIRTSESGLRDDTTAQTGSDGHRVTLSARLTRSLSRSAARGRLERELRSIATDLLGGRPDELPNDCAEWLSATVEAAVAEVCDATLVALAEALDSRLAKAPSNVARRLDEAARRHDAGYA